VPFARGSRRRAGVRPPLQVISDGAAGPVGAIDGGLARSLCQCRHGEVRPLSAFLKRQARDTIRMSFQRLEEIIAAPLSASARSDRTWWGNTVNRTRVQAHAWLNAGWKVEVVDLARESVTFTRGRL
jgi:hypothetical protein